MNVVINPKYAYLRDWLAKIPSFFAEGGRIINKKRNIVKVFSIDGGLEVNIKKFHKPHPFNRIIYTFFRKSKAYRSYYNSLYIAEKGFNAAESIAYIEILAGGLLSDSYYISLQCSDSIEMRTYYSGPLPGNEPVIDSFARYTANLHDAGIYHLDYSPGNILIRYVGLKYDFVLVDVNRMKFMQVSNRSGCRNFARLFSDDAIYQRLAITYAQTRKQSFDKEAALRLMMKYKNRFLRKKAWKKHLRSYFNPSPKCLA